MPGRDPEAARRSKLVATEIKKAMRKAGLSGVELRAKIEAIRGPVPNAMWVSRRLNGDVNLVQPVRVVYGPTADLELIAQALDVKAERLVRVLNTRAQDGTTDHESTTGRADQGQAASETAEQ